MRRDELLSLVMRLGKEFKARRMEEQLRSLRLYYLALRHHLANGFSVYLAWDRNLTIEWFKLLDLPPFRGSYEITTRRTCKTCGTSTQGTLITQAVFSGGHKAWCKRCNAVWIVRRSGD